MVVRKGGGRWTRVVETQREVRSRELFLGSARGWHCAAGNEGKNSNYSGTHLGFFLRGTAAPVKFASAAYSASSNLEISSSNRVQAFRERTRIVRVA